MGEAIRLSGMILETVVGAGGMAEVYRATTSTGDTVAVKVMRADLANVPRHREAFFREIRSVARLRHPYIVEVKSIGLVSADEGESSGGRLVPGTPYLVMDHVTGGTLPPKPSAYDWPRLKEVLVDLLDALAHAHALGVVHRDLKPANVLLEAHHIKLVDFGIARVLDLEEVDVQGVEPKRVTGTPTNMAPEQVLGHWRDEGPWTDLYSLGIVAWGLTCGNRPFEGETRDVLAAQIRSPLPPFQASFAVPEQFESWLRKLLAKRPCDRFRFAADAACGLVAMRSVAADDMSPDSRTDIIRAPLPQSWRRSSAPPLELSSPMGLELFGMRSAPMIGREHERDVLWSAITECEERRVPALILLCGAGGVGKTRLTEWVEQCAHELGSANVLRAQFNEYPGHGDGIAPMLERFFRTGGLDREGVFERVARLLGEYGARGAQFASDLMAVVDILRPRDGIGLRHRSERESFLALGRTLGHIASERPVLLCVENVQWSEEAARFIESVIEHGTGRIAIVASLGPGTATEPITARLAALRGARSVESGRMPDPEIRQLLESLVRLAPRLLDHVVAEAQGNPRAAIELVTAWVQSGALEGSERGYVTGEHESTLPFSVGSMWTATVDRVCAAFGGRGPEMHLLIELAAVLGDAVDPNDWAAAAGQMGLALPASLIEALVFEGLLLQRDDVLRFRTNRVAEMIREGARTDHERWKTLNAACATVLDGLLRDSVDPHQLLRIGRHAVEAELWDFAFEALVHAGVRTHNASPDEVRATWELRNQALERMNAPPDHEQFLWNECLQASLAVYSGDSEHASQILEGVAARCGAPGRERLLAYATRNLAVLLAPSDPVRAAIVYDRSIATYAAIGDVDLEGLTLCNSVNLFAIMGQVDEARARLGRARQLLGTREGTEAEIELTYQEGQLARLEGDLESAHRLFEKAAHLAAVAGWSARAALALSDAADAMRMLGRLDEAEEVLLRVLEIASAMGQKQHYETIRMNLSLIASERGEHEKAWELACAVREAGMRGAIEHFVAAVHLPAAAGTGRFEAFDDAAAQCEALSAKFGVTDWDLAWTAGEAGDLAVAAGETARAERAYKLALEQLRALGSDKGDAVQAKLRALRERR